MFFSAIVKLSNKPHLSNSWSLTGKWKAFFFSVVQTNSYNIPTKRKFYSKYKTSLKIRNLPLTFVPEFIFLQCPLNVPCHHSNPTRWLQLLYVNFSIFSYCITIYLAKFKIKYKPIFSCITILCWRSVAMFISVSWKFYVNSIDIKIW